MNRYGRTFPPPWAVNSSTFGDGLIRTQSSMDSGWKWNNVSSTNFFSSSVGLSRSIQRKRFVSLSNVGIRNISMSRVCRRPCVVNASERIMMTTRILVQARGKAGGADMEMAAFIDKQIAVRLASGNLTPATPTKR
jgi:hypothetical protein